MEEIIEIESDDLGEETSRQLASVQRVVSLTPIAGADRIELATILGWKCVVQKGLHNEGNLVCYIEYDSVLPDISLFKFMEPYKFRIKTIKLRGQVSQGIVLPLIEVCQHLSADVTSFKEGDDLTELLGVKKYVKPIRNITGTQFGTMRPKGNFPSHIISKTDEIRIQAKPSLIEEMQNVPCIARVKADGSSLTCGWDTVRNEPEFCVCSRNNMLQEVEDSAFWMVVNDYGLKEKLQLYPYIWIQGELVGGRIRGNKLGIKGYDLLVFNMYNTYEGRYLNDDELIDMSNKLGLKLCPEAFRGVFTFKAIDDLVELSKGLYESGKQREGIVIRPIVEKYSESLKGRMSFKVINPLYLVENDE